MLKHAYLYKNSILPVINEEISKDRCKFYQNDPTRFYENFESWAWTKEEFVSINEDDKINGYLAGHIDRYSNTIKELSILGLPNRIKSNFDKDIYDFCKYLLTKYIKIKFSCFIGNPAERKWDDLVLNKLNGRIVGVLEKDVILRDGKYYDRKLYEILSKN